MNLKKVIKNHQDILHSARLENSNAKILTVGESYVTPGNWAGFPPHKHDEDNMPQECIAEEIYYYLFDPKHAWMAV